MCVEDKEGEAALSRDNWWEVIGCGGWTNEAVYMEYLWRVVLPYTGGRPATIVHDSLTSHNTPAVTSFLHFHNLSPIVVPAGETSRLQPLDVGVFGPLKSHVRARWNEEKQKHRGRVDTQYASMSLHVEALTEMRREVVRHALEKAVPALAA